MDEAHLYSRILGSLAAACIGDALGAPTEVRSIGEIRRIWGGRIDRFYPPPEDAPFAAGRAAGQITDDASLMLALSDAYLDGGGLPLTAQRMARALLRWAENPEFYPRFVGPSTRAGIERLRAGADPASAGRLGMHLSEGTSNGASMRVAPAGLVHPGDPEAAVHDALTSCLPTHATTVAMAGAACVAAAIAAAMVPATALLDVTRAALWGAERGEQLARQLGRDAAGPSVLRRLSLAFERAARARSFDEAVQDIAECVGTGVHTSEAVPAAVGIFLAASGDPLLAVTGGASSGADTDTVACIAGSLAGAFSGFEAVPHALYMQMLAANGLDLEKTARALTALAMHVPPGESIRR